MLTYLTMTGVMFFILTFLLVYIAVHSINETNMINVDNSDLISAGIVMFILSLVWPITALALVCMLSLWCVWKLTAFCVRVRICGKR